MSRGAAIASACLALLLTGCGGAGPHSTTTAPVSAAPASTVGPTAEPVAIRRRRHARVFHFEASTLSPALRAELRGTSWHPGCPVGLSRLRYLRIGYWGFDHRVHLGEMVVNVAVVRSVRHSFAALFAARFPIRHMWLVDRFGGSDYDSIEADNTSAFNCRDATGSSRWSEHAYGEAIDVNPIENPYVYADGTTTHAASDPYLDRADVRPGMAVAGGTLVRAFNSIGWGWGGRWPRPTDYQHFSVNGR